MASNVNTSSYWEQYKAEKESGKDTTSAWESYKQEKAKTESLARTANVTNRMFEGSDIMGRVTAPVVTPTVESKPTRTGDEIRTELSAVQDELANTYGTVQFGSEEETAKKQEELKAREKALKAELEAVEPTNAQKVGLALKSIGNANVGSLWSLGETAVQGAKNTVEEFQDEEYRTTLGDLTAAKEKLRFAERSKNMSAKAMSDYEAALAEVNRLQAKLDSLQVKTSVGAYSLGQQTLAKANEQKEAALKGTEGVGRWVGENLISVAQNASMLPLAAVNPTLPAIAMGTIAAGSKAAELNAQGVAPGEALIRGGVSGGIEALTEKIPLDNILDMVKVGGKSAIKNLLKQAGTEAGEESVSYVLNYIADKAARDPNATFDLKELANAAASGAFSGGIMGGGATLIGNAVNPPATFSNKIETQTTSSPAPAPAPIVNNVYAVAVDNYLSSGKVNNTAANTIIQNPELAKAFTDLTGIELNGTTEQKRNIIQQAARERAFTAQENESAAEDAAIQAEEEYAREKDAETVRNSGYRSYIRGLFNGGVTIQEAMEVFNTPVLKAEWEAVTGKTLPQNETSAIKMIRQTKRDPSKIDLPDIFAENTNNTQNIAGEQIKTADDVVDTVVEKPIVEDTETANNEPFVPPVAPKSKPVMPPVFKDGKVVNQGGYGGNTVGGAEARFQYKEAPTQSVANNMFTEQEKLEHNLKNTHKVYTNAESRYDAQERLKFDYEGEKANLEGEEWGAAEAVMGYQILDDLVKKARETGDWSEVKRWKDIYDQKGTVEGQALQARKQFSGTTAEIVSEAAQNMDSPKLRKLRPQKKAQLLDEVYRQADAYNKIGNGDTDSLIKLIERNSEIRRTTGLFSEKTSKQMDWALHQIAEKYPDAEQFLRDISVSQIRNITSDYNKVGVTEAMKNIRIMNMLSKFSTVMRNLVSNNIFDPLESLSNNVGLIADSLMSVSTGNRTTAFDRSWASKAKRAGSLEGALKSFVEVGLDAPTEDASSRYEGTGGGRTFKMTGNVLERLLSTWSKYENYALQTTDEFQKGGVRAETQRQIDSLKASGKLGKDALSEWADETAKQRTFQNDSALTKAMEGVKGGLNKLHAGSVGAGDILLPFSRVAGNLATQSANYSPIGFFNSMRQVASVMIDAKKGNVDPAAQAQAARNFGRSVSGTALLAGFATLAVKGLIDVAGDDDKDKEALEKAQGKTGTQFNLSATLRFLDGGDAEWKDGDTIVSIGFLDPINSIMAAGALIADEYADDEEFNAGDVLSASFGGIWQALLDLPVMTSVSDLITTYEHAEGDTAGDKAWNTAVDYVASQASSFVVPNAIRGVATGLDNTVRNQYTGDTIGKSTLDSIVSGIPGLRSTLPAYLDPFGREKTQTGNDVLNFLNNNILPGQVSKYKLTDVEAEIESVYNYTGDTTLYPDKSAPGSILYDKQNYPLNAEQKQDYQKTLGSTYIDMVSDMMESDLYKNASEGQKAEYIGIAKDYASAVANKDVVGKDYKMDTVLARSESAEDELGITQSEFLMLYSTLKGEKQKHDADDNNAYSNAEVAKAIKATGLPKEEQTLLWLIENPEWGEKAADAGVSASVYVDFKVATIGKSKKEDILKAINRMGISKAQKDKLYYAAGYAESKIAEAPWR